ncbi:MAG: lytic transglycosylase domain-containing protein [Ferruginibacter sp.]|nr:lytic transglycosylase domain-containing protein [Ferruginibacter sp.]
MILKNSPKKVSIKSIIFFICTSLLFAFKTLSGQNKTDTTKNPLIASLNKKSEPGYIVRKSNVVYPEILKGNEEEMMGYIEKFIRNKRDYLVAMYSKGKFFLPKAASILKNYNLPEELKVLVTLESAYNGNAVSKAGAVGYWQIMDELAGEYGMKYIARTSGAENKKIKQDGKNGLNKVKPGVKIRDDRKNFNKSTHTAARYLRDQSRHLAENWLLVVASYNCGAGNVRKAIKKSGLLNPTFWDIKNYLPLETRSFVMNFITLNVIFNNYEMFSLNKLRFAPDKVMISTDFENNLPDLPYEYSTL